MRLSANLTQMQLGKKVGLADTTISSYERENSNPTFDNIIKIAKVCGYRLKVMDRERKYNWYWRMGERKRFLMLFILSTILCKNIDN